MKKIRNTKSILLLTLVIAIVLGGVSGTLAYLIDRADEVENIFNPASVTSAVVEKSWTTGALVKKNVQIRNTGNIDAVIRAAIVVTWQVDGETLPELPLLGTDYTLTTGNDWTPSGGFYYYNKKVAPNTNTTDLIVECRPIKKYNDGRVLCVEVIGSAIQDEPVAGETWTIPQ